MIWGYIHIGCSFYRPNAFDDGIITVNISSYVIIYWYVYYIQLHRYVYTYLRRAEYSIIIGTQIYILGIIFYIPPVQWNFLGTPTTLRQQVQTYYNRSLQTRVVDTIHTMDHITTCVTQILEIPDYIKSSRSRVEQKTQRSLHDVPQLRRLLL